MVFNGIYWLFSLTRAHNTSVVTGSEPCLCLRVDMKPFEESSDDWDVPSTVSVITQFRTGTAQEVKPSQRLPGLIMNQVRLLHAIAVLNCFSALHCTTFVVVCKCSLNLYTTSAFNYSSFQCMQYVLYLLVYWFFDIVLALFLAYLPILLN